MTKMLTIIDISNWVNHKGIYPKIFPLILCATCRINVLRRIWRRNSKSKKAIKLKLYEDIYG